MERQPRLRRHDLRIVDPGALAAVGGELPAVERAGDGAILDLAAGMRRQMGAQMRAIGIGHPCCAVRRPEGNIMRTEIGERQQGIRGHFLRRRHPEPAVGIGRQAGSIADRQVRDFACLRTRVKIAVGVIWHVFLPARVTAASSFPSTPVCAPIPCGCSKWRCLLLFRKDGGTFDKSRDARPCSLVHAGPIA
jgi:hypothetical protein